jgi:hypothetical protein
MKGGAQDIKDHPFFANYLDFDALVARTLEAPWVPELDNPLDTHHFDEYSDDDDVEPYDNGGDEWDRDF